MSIPKIRTAIVQEQIAHNGLNAIKPEYAAPKWRAAQKRWVDSMKVRDELIRNEIAAWAKHKGVETFVRLEISFSYVNGKIERGSMFSLFNGKGSVDKKTRWLNKVSVLENGYVVSHKARTDPKFLMPLDTEFAAYIKDLVEKINEELK